MKTYPIINHAKLKYNATMIICGIWASIAIVANIIVGLNRFGEYKVGIIIGIELFFAVLIIIPVTLMIVSIKQKSVLFYMVGYDEIGIHIFDSNGKEHQRYTWSEIKDSGIILTLSHDTHDQVIFDIIAEMIISLFSNEDSGKRIYFSKKPLDDKAKKCDDVKIEDSFISVQYSEESLFEIKKYYPNFGISER